MRHLAACLARSAASALASLVILGAPPQAMAEDVAQPVSAFLEGVWLIGAPPDRGACLSHPYLDNEIEFEFRKTGGRALYFEPPDLYSAVSIADISTDGEVVSLTARTRDGKTVPFMRLRRLGRDAFEWLPRMDADPDSKPEEVYRCGSPNRAVTGDIPLATLSLLTPPISGAEGLLEIWPGESDHDVCQGVTNSPDPSVRRRWLQIELLGPAHFWVFGDGFSRDYPLDFDRVESVSQQGASTLKLAMRVGAWGRGKRYELTAHFVDDRVEIPELNATFVRCRPDEKGSWGMHRM